jgi:phage terminase small subunit
MSTELTKKQKGFVKDYIETGNGTQAALNNYDTIDYSTAGNIASDNLRKPKVIEAIAEQIPDDLLVRKHLQLLNKTDEKGEIDVQAVKAGLDMGYKVKGSYAPDKVVNLTITHEQTPEALALAEKYEQELKKTL